jgi:hypothetical protein
MDRSITWYAFAKHILSWGFGMGVELQDISVDVNRWTGLRPENLWYSEIHLIV